jgi:hypothetical protein
MQLNCFSPSIVIAYFTSRTRKEYVKGQRVFSLQPSLLADSFPTTGGGRGKSLIEASYDYYAFYTDEMGFIDSMRNMLLVKSQCEKLGIPYVFAWHDFADFSNPKFTRNIMCRSFIDMLDHRRICDFSLRSMEVDRARDGIHCGPRTNDLFGQALFGFFVEAQEGGARAIP